MAARQGLRLRQGAGLALTPETRLSMRLLALPTVALVDELAARAEENPFLELTLPASGTVLGVFEDQIAVPPDLGTSLRRQIGEMSLRPDVAEAAYAITWALSDAGFLDLSLEEVAETLGVDVSVVEESLSAVQACEPAGVAARSFSESLTLQLEDLGIPHEAAVRAPAVLVEIAENDPDAAAAATGLDQVDIARIAAVLDRLSPFPGSAFQPEPESRIPDLEALPDGSGKVTIVLHDTSLPVLRTLGPAPAELRDKGAEAELLGHRAAADTLVRALRFRHSTLIRVGRALAEHQSGFFRSGVSAMAPLTRQELAQSLGLHPSTIGRAISGKSLLHAGGITPLSTFFPTALAGGETSAAAVQFRIAALIGSESAAQPLSDSQISRHLQNEGVDIARRTVAKYRGCLNIPSSYHRRKPKADRARPGMVRDADV